MLMPLTQIQDGKGFIGVTTPLPNARSLFFLTSLAAISEDGTCFSLSTAVLIIASTSFHCLLGFPYLPFAASTGLVDWLLPFWISLHSNSLYKTVQETALPTR